MRQSKARRIAAGRARINNATHLPGTWTQVRDAKGRFGPASFTWIGLEDISKDLFDMRENIKGKMAQNVEALKDEMVAYMKANAPWQDRTGDARANLQGAVQKHSDTSYTILLGHGTSIYYGVYLEFAFGGRYAIVLPTLHHFQPMLGGRIFQP